MGPNINNMQIEAPQIAQAAFAIGLAKLHVQRASEKERELIDALAKRYATQVPEDRAPLNKAYSDAMRKLFTKYPDDALVTALFAESLMNLSPWKLWSPAGQPAEITPELIKALEHGLQRSPDHPGLCHFYIHTMEASRTPEKALAAADRLDKLMPGSGHLVHMPSHIYALLGDYERVIDSNHRAIKQDTEFARREGPFNFYTLYRIHNYHFLVYGAMFDGQRELAMRAAQQLVDEVPEEMLKSQTDFLDAFMPMPLHVMVRFGEWEKILAQPEAADYLPVTRAMRRYARAVAYAATGRVEEAKAEHQELLREMAEVPDTSFLFQNASINILGVAEKMVVGEIAYREGDYDVAFEHLREAVRRDDALNYDEPWGWMQPARHALGALLLEQGHAAEAERVYRADLTRHPHNVWALHGLAEALDKQGKQVQADELRAEFQTAAKRIDVKIDRSCFCRNGVEGK
jgi:tetratricopeptide (TPR) repeat protein